VFRENGKQGIKKNGGGIQPHRVTKTGKLKNRRAFRKPQLKGKKKEPGFGTTETKACWQAGPSGKLDGYGKQKKAISGKNRKEKARTAGRLGKITRPRVASPWQN